MDKPMNKKELLDMSDTRYLNIMTIISELSAKERVKEWKTKERDKNLRDLIYHLYAWHQLLLRWLKILGEGGKPALPKEGYTWDDLDALNHEIWLEAQQHPFMDTLERFEMSHQSCMAIIKELPEEAIFKPYYVQFSHPILSLVDGCMADHYHWALTKMNEHYTQKSES